MDDVVRATDALCSDCHRRSALAGEQNNLIRCGIALLFPFEHVAI
jgi:hypothetical protein